MINNNNKEATETWHQLRSTDELISHFCCKTLSRCFEKSLTLRLTQGLAIYLYFLGLLHTSIRYGLGESKAEAWRLNASDM